MIVIVALIWTLGLLAGSVCFVRAPGTLLRRLTFALLPVSAGAVLVMIVLGVLQLGSTEWTEAKLAPIVGMTRGYALYQDPDNGVMTGWIYGPIGALVLLPAALGHDPTTAGIIGSS